MRVESLYIYIYIYIISAVAWSQRRRPARRAGEKEGKKRGQRLSPLSSLSPLPLFLSLSHTHTQPMWPLCGATHAPPPPPLLSHTLPMTTSQSAVAWINPCALWQIFSSTAFSERPRPARSRREGHAGAGANALTEQAFSPAPHTDADRQISAPVRFRPMFQPRCRIALRFR